MANKGTSYVDPARNSWGILSLLISAASEWLLMFLLFVDAAFSYLLTKFARYCKLQTPCILCSRLDHVFGNEKPGFYRSLLCRDHRKEISSLITCHAHGKLADAREMCEECLMSFATQNNSSSESSRLLVGKLGYDLNQYGFQSTFLDKNVLHGSSSPRTCSCCRKIWKARSSSQRLVQLTPIGLACIKHNLKPPLPRVPIHGRLNQRDNLKKMRDKFSEPLAPLRVGKIGVEPLSQVGYTELKITSDSESEVQFSDDDDDASSLIHGNIDSKEVQVIQRSSGILPKAHNGNVAIAKQTQQTFNSEPSLLDQFVQLDAGDNLKSSASADITGIGAGELKPNTSDMIQPVSLNDINLSTVVKAPMSASANDTNVPLPQNFSLSVVSDILSSNDNPPSPSIIDIPLGALPEKIDAIRAREAEHTAAIKHAEQSESMAAAILMPMLSPRDKCKLPVSPKGREISDMPVELAVNSDKVHDLISPAHGIGQSLHDKSLEIHGQDAKLQKGNDSNTIQAPQNPSSLEKYGSGCESLDGSAISDNEGEISIDGLKQEVEQYKKFMNDLFKELEEERNAAAIAANQAMAMITRLQGEKASLHMEALQYLRMMEEQAKYDMDALTKANDILAEKEKEMQDLEAELEVYRINYPEETMGESVPGATSYSKAYDMKVEKDFIPETTANTNNPFDSMPTEIYEGGDGIDNIAYSFANVEDEKIYILQCLEKLEAKLLELPGNIEPNGGSSEKLAIEEKNLETNDGGVDITVLENEILYLNERLRAFDADHDYLNHSFNSVCNGNEGLLFIQEIAHWLRDLRKIGNEKRCLPLR